MTLEDMVITNYGMVGRIGSIEDVDGVTYYTVYFDDGAVNDLLLIIWRLYNE